MKRLFALCLTLIMAFTCCACADTDTDTDAASVTAPSTSSQEELTLSEITDKMQEALQETPCSKASLVVNLSMTLAAEDMGTLDLVIRNTSETTFSQDPVSSYCAVETEVICGEETIQTQTENYSVVEAGELVSYVNSGGVWLKLPTGQTAEEFSSSSSLAAADLSNVAIDEAVTEWNSQKAICLKTDLTGDAIQNALGGMLENMDSLSGALGESEDLFASVDYSKLTGSAVLYLDAETFLPLAEEMDFDGMSEVMAPLYQSMGISVQVTDFFADAVFTSYDKQPAVTLPEGAAEKAEAWTRLLSGEPDNGDGTFTIREGTALIDIVHPEGFELVEKDYDHVTFQRDDYRQIIYTMYYLRGEDTTGDSFLAKNDAAVDRWTTGGGKVSREQLTLSTDTLCFTCDLLATAWDAGREDANFYAWSALGNDSEGTYYLYIQVTDGYNDGMGFSKSADITSDEFLAYLNAAAPGKVTAE